jgi:hypothetical protein
MSEQNRRALAGAKSRGPQKAKVCYACFCRNEPGEAHREGSRTARHKLFVAQRHHGIDLGRPPRGNVARK